MVVDSPTSSVASPVSWVALTIDCPDAEVQERLRHFYAEALGGEVVSGSVRARGWLLIFEVIADYKPPTWPLGETPKQMHFEWMVKDLESAVGRLQSLGATLAEYQRPEDVGFRVMLDPAGHPFCVATTGVTPVFQDEGEQTAPLTATPPAWLAELVPVGVLGLRGSSQHPWSWRCC